MWAIEFYQASRVQVNDPNCKEIAVKINLNDSMAEAIFVTGFPATVISNGLFKRMRNQFEENKIMVKSNLKNQPLNYFIAKSPKYWKYCENVTSCEAQPVSVHKTSDRSSWSCARLPDERSSPVALNDDRDIVKGKASYLKRWLKIRTRL